MQPVILGPREMKFGDVKVFFDETSTIQFEDGDNFISLDPTEISAVYWAYIGMKKELNDEK